MKIAIGVQQERDRNSYSHISVSVRGIGALATLLQNNFALGENKRKKLDSFYFDQDEDSEEDVDIEALIVNLRYQWIVEISPILFSVGHTVSEMLLSDYTRDSELKDKTLLLSEAYFGFMVVVNHVLRHGNNGTSITLTPTY